MRRFEGEALLESGRALRELGREAEARARLQQALGITSTTTQPVYFEALIRTQAVAGAPNATSIVATRLLHP